MLFIRLYLCKKSIIHVSDQLAQVCQVWSVCWVETNTNSTANLCLKMLLVSSRGVTPPDTDCVGHLAKKDGLKDQL